MSDKEHSQIEQARLYFESLEKELDAIQDEDDDTIRTDLVDDFLEGILEVIPVIRYNVLLATGGPAYGLFIYIDPTDREIDKIEFWYQDWFTAKTILPVEGSMFDVLTELFDYLLDMRVEG